MRFFSRLFQFAKKVAKSAFIAVKDFVKSLVNNAAGVALLAGAAIGFTKLATELPFQMAMPLWIESFMVAPIIGAIAVFILVQLMKLQLSFQHE